MPNPRPEARKGSYLRIQTSSLSRPTRSRSARVVEHGPSSVPGSHVHASCSRSVNSRTQVLPVDHITDPPDVLEWPATEFRETMLPLVVPPEVYQGIEQATELPMVVPRVPLESSDAEYMHALEKVGAIFPISQYIFVFQDWNEVSKMLQIGVYYHVTRLPRSEDEYGISCTCPRWKAHYTCCHQRILFHSANDYSKLPHLAPAPTPPAVFLQSTPFQDLHIFSCSSSSSGSRYESSKRTIVTFQRSGRWYCQSCRFSDACKHRPHALAFAIEAGLISEGLQENSSGTGQEDQDDQENMLLMQAGGRDDGLGSRGCVSHLPIPPPRWCSLSSEQSFNAPKPTFQGHHFALNNTGQCSCGTSAAAALSALHSEAFPYAVGSCVEEQQAILFSLTNRYKVSVEVMACPTCRHSRRYVGPDLSCHGVFNWNNTMLFTHDLLNGFTNMFTASETPFSAFCLTVSRAYMEHGMDVKFCSDDTFVRVWFAFIRLQELESGMRCPTCGPSPKIVIADGISLGINSSKLTRCVRPPTLTDRTSPSIESISSYKARGLPAVIQAEIRSLVHKLLEISTSHAICPFPNTQQLESAYPELFALINLYFRLGVASKHHKSYRGFIQQIVAPDIVLQLIPYAAIAPLRNMAENPSADIPAWLQCLVPAFGRVINSHHNEKSPIPQELHGIAAWLSRRASEVYLRLAQHEPAPPETVPPEQWELTGTYYGLPAIRYRRAYPKLRHDSSVLDREADEMGDCNKFYKTYAKNRLTGGILVLWCTHSICLGFHTIPVAEGRNDVFSAIYTRFPIAPEIIVYDFACQLAPYCLVREAAYFRNTKFLIDEMHAHDHTRCGQACFSSNSMEFDDRIRAINTSAAECGNKGMKRIRKSVSFMVSDHAVLFTKAFLDVWNRGIINRMKKV
ncbi:hypothetical protein D9615_003373 [Tricholomella constricta]|uniref:SWIM-type domain-containing protein n=1 Tax=Tricholomella constricta TaxID=117010 RepID=A0A8H5M7K3_9AGAR|nr:hypothetical protein D9615_003373 [Tricholomella constricta]